MVQTILQCPYSGGKPVYQMRAIAQYFNDSIEYNDDVNCLQQGIYRHTENSAKYKVSANDFVVYPNPAQDKIHVNIKNKIEGLCRMELLSTTGAILQTTSFNCEEKNYETDISHLKEGMYYVKIEFNNEYRFISKLAIIR